MPYETDAGDLIDFATRWADLGDAVASQVSAVVDDPATDEVNPNAIELARQHCPGHGQVAKPLVSWIAWKAEPKGLWYSRLSPATRSSTRRVTSRLVRPPAKIQYLSHGGAHASSTFTSSSRLLGAKNQNAPVSRVRWTACPALSSDRESLHDTMTRKRSARHRVWSSGRHRAGEGSPSSGSFHSSMS